jgi:hypothetical protein
MPEEPNPLLPSIQEIQALSSEKLAIIAGLTDAVHRRNFLYAMTGKICAALCFLGCLAVFGFLVNAGHDTAAGIVLGATVPATIGRMIGPR